jgi:general secretion pathway protein G
LLASVRARRSRIPRGFTVVELLSVVAIIGTVSALAFPNLHEAIQRARVGQTIGDIKSMSAHLSSLDSLPDALASLGPVPLDPWGRPYQYLKFPQGQVPVGARRDRFLVPVNTAFDLYSYGKDGASAPVLSASTSQDDVISANDGGYIGLGSKY